MEEPEPKAVANRGGAGQHSPRLLTQPLQPAPQHQPHIVRDRDLGTGKLGAKLARPVKDFPVLDSMAVELFNKKWVPLRVLEHEMHQLRGRLPLTQVAQHLGYRPLG